MAARENPYVQRLIEDEQIHDDLRTAYDAARGAYGRLSNGKGPAKALKDKKVQRDLRVAAESLRDASERLRAKRQRRRGRIIVIALVAAGLAILLSEGGRKALLDRLFGSEEEFEYTSTTSATPETATA